MALETKKPLDGSHEESPLSLLPVEIQHDIAAYLVSPAQLNSLSRTCRRIRSIVQPKLYQHLTLIIPRDWSNLVCLENLLDPKAEGLQYTRGMTFIIKPHKVETEDDYVPTSRDDLDEFKDMDYPYVGGRDTLKCSFRKQRLKARFLDTLVRLILCRIPEQRLQFFYWYLHYQLESSTLGLVSSRHGSALRDLRVHNAAALHNCDLSKLITLHYKDLNPYKLGIEVPESLVKNRNTLRHLKLGFEMYLTSRDSPLSHGELETIFGAQKYFYREIKYSLQECGLQDKGGKELGAWLWLETLHLICFDVTERSLPNFDFRNLKSLRIESCTKEPGLFSLLGSRSTKKGSTWVPKLTSFHLRHESSTTAFQASLKSFLLSFTGLIHLSLLLEGPDLVPSIAPFLRNHGATLQTLVWDQRSELRHLASRPTDIFQDGSAWYSASEIVSCCPNLRELGFASNATHDNLSYRHIWRLTKLKHLETLNIRSLPKQADDGIKPMSSRHKHEALAADIAKKFGSACPSGCYPKLKVIAIGSITHRDTWPGRSNRSSGPTDLYLCPRFFHVAWPINIKNRRAPVLTPIGQGRATEAQEYSNNLHIFEPYWLS